MKAKKSIQKNNFEVAQRSGVDPHEEFNPDALGMQDWGDGFFVDAEPVLIERDSRGAIARTTPISEAVRTGKLTPPQYSIDGEVVEAPTKQRKMQPMFRQEQIVEMLANYAMVIFGNAKPGQLAYNPLYDGIPISEALHDDRIFNPTDKTGLVHVPAGEVHEWLRKVIGKRAQIINAKTGKKGWGSDLNDTVVSFNRVT